MMMLCINPRPRAKQEGEKCEADRLRRSSTKELIGPYTVGFPASYVVR